MMSNEVSEEEAHMDCQIPQPCSRAKMSQEQKSHASLLRWLHRRHRNARALTSHSYCATLHSLLSRKPIPLPFLILVTKLMMKPPTFGESAPTQVGHKSASSHLESKDPGHF